MAYLLYFIIDYAIYDVLKICNLLHFCHVDICFRNSEIIGASHAIVNLSHRLFVQWP